MKKCYGYVRVSTVKQGTHGVSLQEQRAAIERYCANNSLTIINWFEERETAAKGGRPVFSNMLRLLQMGQADAVVIHKIDRSTRNLRDWANLGELIDKNIDVYFANESIDLRSRGGRLSADIQAVVASDYIRNLREETRKGFYGRLKQGYYPLPAPIGYLDQGGGEHKIHDPVRAPIVKQAFELYSTGKFSTRELSEKLYDLGLRNLRGGRVSKTGVANILGNPFYVGIIKIKTTEEHFEGGHVPLVSKSLFDRVRNVADGRNYAKPIRHDFLYRRRITCSLCGLRLIGEIQKGHIYYRCHTRNCQMKGVRETKIHDAVERSLARIQLLPEEHKFARQEIVRVKERKAEFKQVQLRAYKLQLSKLSDRLLKLTDAFLDSTVEKELFEERKMALMLERQSTKDEIARLTMDSERALSELEEKLELANKAWLSYRLGTLDEKRQLLDSLTSNQTATPENVAVELQFPFNELANRTRVPEGCPYRVVPRTFWADFVNRFMSKTTMSKANTLSPARGKSEL